MSRRLLTGRFAISRYPAGGLFVDVDGLLLGLAAVRWITLSVVVLAWPRLIGALAHRLVLSPGAVEQLLAWRWRAAFGIALVEGLAWYPALVSVAS